MMGPPLNSRPPIPSFLQPFPPQRSQSSFPMPPPSQRQPGPFRPTTFNRPRSASVTPAFDNPFGQLPPSSQDSIAPPSSQGSTKEGWNMVGGNGLVDSYRPNTNGPPRSAAEEFMRRNEPKISTGEKVLQAVTALTSRFTNLENTCQALQSDNKQLRDQLHELQTGQRALATREDIMEEMSAQLPPALDEFFRSLDEKLCLALAPLPEVTSDKTAEKVRAVLLQIKTYEQQIKAAEGNPQKPILDLMTHLITNLQPIHSISNILTSLQDLPKAVSDVAIFSKCIDTLLNRMNQQPQLSHHASSAAISTLEDSPRVSESLAGLKQSVEELRAQMTARPSGSVGGAAGDNERILEAITALQKAVQDLGNRPSPSSVPATSVSVDMLEAITAIKADISDIKSRLDTLQSTSTDIVNGRSSLDGLRMAVEGFHAQCYRTDHSAPSDIPERHSPPTPYSRNVALGLRPPQTATTGRGDMSSPTAVSNTLVADPFPLADIFGPNVPATKPKRKKFAQVPRRTATMSSTLRSEPDSQVQVQASLPVVPAKKKSKSAPIITSNYRTRSQSASDRSSDASKAKTTTAANGPEIFDVDTSSNETKQPSSSSLLPVSQALAQVSTNDPNGSLNSIESQPLNTQIPNGETFAQAQPRFQSSYDMSIINPPAPAPLSRSSSSASRLTTYGSAVKKRGAAGLGGVKGIAAKRKLLESDDESPEDAAFPSWVP